MTLKKSALIVAALLTFALTAFGILLPEEAQLIRNRLAGWYYSLSMHMDQGNYQWVSLAVACVVAMIGHSVYVRRRLPKMAVNAFFEQSSPDEATQRVRKNALIDLVKERKTALKVKQDEFDASLGRIIKAEHIRDRRLDAKRNTHAQAERATQALFQAESNLNTEVTQSSALRSAVNALDESIKEMEAEIATLA